MIRTYLASIATICCVPLITLGGPSIELSQVASKGDQPAENPRALIERIKANQERVRKLLGDKDSGDQTRKLQRQIAADLAKLLETPDGANPNPPPRGGDSDRPSPPSPNPKQAPTEPDNADTPARAKPREVGPEGSAESRSRAKERPAGKDGAGYWGEYPPLLRKILDAHPRDRLMPRYEEMLRVYYRTISERSPSKEGDQP